MPELMAKPTPVAPSESAPTQASPTPETTQAPATPDKVSSKFAALAKKEKAALAKLEAAKAREAEIAAKEAALAAREAKLSEFETVKQTNPMKALEMMGLTYQDLTQTVLNGNEITPEMQINNLRKEVESFKEQQERLAKEQAEAAAKRQAEEEAEVLQSFRSEIESFVKSQGSKFELIQSFNQANLVYETIDAQFQKTGRLLSIAEASEMVEKYLEGEIEKALNVPKVKSKISPPAPASEAKKPASFANAFGPKPAKTLTNAASTAAMQSKPQVLTERERLERARARLRGQLT